MGVRKSTATWARWLAVVALLAPSVAGCGGTARGAPEDSYSIGIAEPSTLLPGDVRGGPGARVVDALFTGLVRYYSGTGQPLLAVADSISSRDERHWTIRIEKGWTFHNGEPVTSENFVRAWNATAYGPHGWSGNDLLSRIQGYRALNPEDPDGDGPKQPPKPESKRLSGLEVVNDRTFTVTLTEPFSQFPAMLGQAAFMPLPKVAFGNYQEFASEPIGNGPYQMAGPWHHSDNLSLGRYDDYTKGDERSAESEDDGEDEENVKYRGGRFEAEVQELTYKIYARSGAAYRDLQEGRLDIMPAVPAARFDEADEDFGSRFVFRPGATMTYLGFPLYQDGFDDPRLRRAISMAINREKLVTDFFAGVHTPAASLTSPALLAAQAQPCADLCEYHPQRARKLFQAAGGYDGTLRLWYSSGSADQRWVRAIGSMLERTLGVDKVELRKRESLVRDAEPKTNGPRQFAWTPAYLSLHSYLAPMFTTQGAANHTGYANERVDTLVRQGARAESMHEATDYYHHAENIVLGDMPVVPLWVNNTNAAHSPHVSNVIVGLQGHIRVAQVQES